MPTKITKPQSWISVRQSSSGTEIKVNTSQAPTPSRRMSANWVDVKYDGQTARLFFGHLHPYKKAMIALLEVQIPKRILKEKIIDDTRFIEAVERHTEELGSAPVGMPAPEEYVLERFLSDQALFIFAAVNEHQGELRFYCVSPYELSRADKREEETEVAYPVVSVMMNPAVFCGLIATLVKDLREEQ